MTTLMDMKTIDKIQSKVAEFAAQGYQIKATNDDRLAAPYTEHFYDNCVAFWCEAGVGELKEIREIVDAAVKELEAVNA